MRVLRPAFDYYVDEFAGPNKPTGPAWEKWVANYLDRDDYDTAWYMAAAALNDWEARREALREQILEREAILAAMDEAHQ